jgi:NAD(P)-dependent dehydrogenase (short-subunit alcohol dehydrogenase family)
VRSEGEPVSESLSGKIAIVTGASRGIGKQIALELGRLGANVVVAARTVSPRRQLPGTISETVDGIEALGGTALAVAADMAKPEDLDRLVAATVERFGGVDILINNAAATAGKAWGASLLDLSREEWQQQFDVNLNAPFTLIRLVTPIMARRGGGRIVNLTTGTHGGDEPAPGISTPLAYPASKAALDQFCVSVAPQLRAMQISITNVHPGFVRTEMVDLMVQNGIDASAAISMDIPTQAVRYLSTCDDPFEYSGKIVFAETLIASGLSAP